MSNKQQATDDELLQQFEAFVAQYELDMRGDKKINGGNIGVINTIRKMRETQEKYPSLTWLLAHRPVPTLASIFGAFVVLQLVYTYTPPLFTAVLTLLGVHIP